MYKNRLRRTPTKRPLHFAIRRSDFATDERNVYIESVCAVLLESRFGPGNTSPWTFDWNTRPELEPADFLDLCDAEPNGSAPYGTLSPQGGALHQTAEAAYRKAKRLGLFHTSPNTRNSTPNSSANQGRGSP